MPRRSTSPTRIKLPEGHWLDCREKGSPFWHVYWSKPTRGKRSLETTNQATAETRFFDVVLPWRREQLAQAAGTAKRDRDPLWDDLIDWYETEKRHEGVHPTIFVRNLVLRRAVTGLHVSDTNGAFWEQYKTDRRNGKYSNFGRGRATWQNSICRASDGTLLRELRGVLAIIRRGIEAQKVRPDLLPQFRMPAEPTPRTECPSTEQMRKLIDHALATSPPEGEGVLSRIALFVILALLTGGRARAVEGLTWDRVDFDTGLIDLQDPARRRTKKHNATVGIVPELEPVLRRAWRERTSQWVLRNRNSVRNEWDRFCVEAVGVKFRRHDLRHALATKLVNDGVSMDGVAACLGNTQRVVERVYAHHNKAQLARREVLANWKPL